MNWLLTLKGDRQTLRELLNPLSLAGYGTWALVALDQILDGSAFGSASTLATAAVLIAFLLCFMLGNLASHAGRPVEAEWLAAALVPIALLDGLLAPSFVAPILLVVAAGVIASHFTLRRGPALLAVANLAYYFIYANIWEISRPLYQTGLFVGFQAFALFVARMGFAAETARAELAQANAHLLATRSLLENSARDSERLRLSRELHDLAGHHLTALKLNLELAKRLPTDDKPAKIDTALRLSEQVLDDIRGVVSQLREHDGMELKPALEQLSQGWPDVQVSLHVDPMLRIAHVATATALLRCAQESLTNAVRHGHARRIELRLEPAADGVNLGIRDTGTGAAAVTPGNGLTGMRERLQAVGGRVEWASQPGQGFSVQAWVPQTA